MITGTTMSVKSIIFPWRACARRRDLTWLGAKGARVDGAFRKLIIEKIWCLTQSRCRVTPGFACMMDDAGKLDLR
ncbi:MAG: hypothetical protein JW384_02414 [Nitrosomonadaceae bacterium]|nr:hypothetical protein [Nitrosomonadaceae bacterium]